MASLSFTPNLSRLVCCPEGEHPGDTVADVLEAAFATRPETRGYVLDERGALRKHMVVFIDGEQAQDRRHLSDPVGPDAVVFVMQALSGG